MLFGFEIKCKPVHFHSLLVPIFINISSISLEYLYLLCCLEADENIKIVMSLNSLEVIKSTQLEFKKEKY